MMCSTMIIFSNMDLYLKSKESYYHQKARNEAPAQGRLGVSTRAVLFEVGARCGGVPE